MKQLTKGLMCCECMSVIFDVGELVQHIAENQGHNYWKFGKGDGALFIRPMFSREIYDEISWCEEDAVGTPNDAEKVNHEH